MENLTKTQIEIMKIFVGNITKKFSIKEIADKLGKPYALIYNSITGLIKQDFIKLDERKLLFLNFQKNLTELAFFESAKTKEYLGRNKNLKLFWEDCLNTIKSDFFISIIFGSSVYKTGRDVDLLFIFSETDLENNERIIRNIAKNFTLNLDINIVSVESVYEMLSKRERKNVLNEFLDNHLILFGGENFYKILKNARQ
jgi:predicted DNA-binding protein YlxM (UPF0122 family)